MNKSINLYALMQKVLPPPTFQKHFISKQRNQQKKYLGIFPSAPFPM